VATTGTAAEAAVPSEPGQRERILDTALHLMAEHGVHAMSMRRLADGCHLNVATLYHYFPSKADLLTAVIAHRPYGEMLAELPPVDPGAPVRERLEAVLVYVFTEMADEDDMWRLLLGEGLRGDVGVLASAAELSATFEAALNAWFEELLSDVAGERAVMARVLRGAIYGFFVEVLPLPRHERVHLLHARAAEIAQVLVPDA
jgi:AcrR family transcriptional regulator